ncbi:Ger(x)C family spore germination protein [Paenibacillus phocaensis]|uniref:Ger(x)C family spore germination protein n=1 Tax=Paenibacillus phocaensis TaxID=1776378 RepID=UPI000839C57B|nr:Ger(x)C family spore germination protein [Paenibacillus phocaensis]
MIRKAAVLMWLCIVAALLAGCWNRRELNELGIAVAAGVDKIGDRYRLTVQVVDPGQVTAKKGANGGASATLYTSEGDTILEAARRITQISPRKIYLSHLRLYLIGESLAEEGIGQVLDLLSRDHEIRTDFYLVVTKGASAMDTLKIMTPLEPLPANKLFASLESSEKNWSPTIAVTLDELINDLTCEGKHPVMTGLQILGDPEVGQEKKNIANIYTPTQLQYSGLAVFKKTKLIGWLNEQESRGYHHIHGGVKSSVLYIPCPDSGKIVVETIRSKTNVKGKVAQGDPRIEIKVQVEANIAAVGCRNLDLTDTATIAELEKRVETKLVDIMDTTVEKVQKEYGIDIFGFGEAIRRADPGAWKTMKKNWDEEYFTHLPVDIHVDLVIRRIGTISDSFLNQTKE